MRPVEIIRRPVDPDGHVVQDDSLIETLAFGSMRLKGPSSKIVPNIRIQIAQHIDGLWMWSTSIYLSNQGSTYRVRPKWGRFTRTRQYAITAACNELAKNKLPSDVIAWLEQLCGPEQMELFA